jgi:hypothetical protein
MNAPNYTSPTMTIGCLIVLSSSTITSRKAKVSLVLNNKKKSLKSSVYSSPTYSIATMTLTVLSFVGSTGIVILTSPKCLGRRSKTCFNYYATVNRLLGMTNLKLYWRVKKTFTTPLTSLKTPLDPSLSQFS